MKKKPGWKKAVVSALEIPPDLAYKDSIVTLTGDQEVVIENYKNISSYTSEEVVILTGNGKLIVSGKNLEILWYTAYDMKIKGYIFGIFPGRN